MNANSCRGKFARIPTFFGCASLIFLLPGVAAAHQGAPPATSQSATPWASVQQLVLPPTDAAAELKADARTAVPGPLRFAVSRKVSVTPVTDGTWEQLPSGRLWRLRIMSPGATDLNLGFTTYWLPEGATLYLISESQAYYQGPYTAEHNAEHGQLWTAVVPGEAAVLEVFVPEGVQQDPTLVLGQVGTGYRDLFKQQPPVSIPKGDTCEIDVTCSQGAAWTNEIRSVALISIGGSGLCSATLIMDAASDFRPFLLTANHCEITSGNAASVVAYWNYQSACGTHGTTVPSLSSWSQNTSGSSFRAAHADVDFCLVELTRTPSSSYAVYYAGWDRSGVAASSVVGIHHPNGEGKCISFSNGGVTTTDNCIGTGGTSTSTHWRVPWGNQGVTEPGSSGSGIWGATSHRLIGTLSGGDSYCGAPVDMLWDCYGKFSLAWTGNSPGTRLRDWLDPCNSGATTKDGAYPPSRAVIVPGTSALVSEGCTPANGVIDPGELVTVSFALKNVGTVPTANLVATLQTGNGVLSPSAPQTYGVLAAGGAAVSKSFSFVADGTCGQTITPILQLQDGSSTACAPFTFVLGKLAGGLSENFDTTEVYSLPPGWSENSGLIWQLLSGTADTPPNAMWAYEPPSVSDRQLFSPTFTVNSANAQLTFRHSYDTGQEYGYDGGVLEISIGGGPFVDIEAAGGSFVTGGYDTTIDTRYSSPIGGRWAWTGTTGGFITTTANLPASAAGQTVQLCWRFATDNSGDGLGWYVDTVSVATGYTCCSNSVVIAPTLGAPTYSGSQFQFTVTGTAGARYAVEVSTDLANWVGVQTNASPFTYTQSNPGAAQYRFYRAVSRP